MAVIAELKKDFKKLADKNSLFHGYLFFGEGSGEAVNFAKEFINYLESKKWREKPDAVLLDSLILSGFGIDNVRQGIAFLWQKPIRSARKTLIVPDADSLTDEAQNAILKTVEEPPSHALIILIAKNEEVLLPTLVSRLQKIYVHGKSEILNQGIETNPRLKEFFGSSVSRRKEIIKELVDQVKETGEDKILEEFIAGLISELRRDIIKNWKAIKEVLHRWSMIKRYNTNKRLQLETMLQQVKSS
ncbi:MAG: hypothetical protein AAB885_00460 [Patescibacteria group bacterium]